MSTEHSPFIIQAPKADKIPILISVPHSGTDIPSEVKSTYLETQLNKLDDTDWFVHDLYDFASELGITIIRAKYSRWLIDLNRNPDSEPLYKDGRLITGLCSTTDFLGNPIYKAAENPTVHEINRRLNTYYWPYYNQITSILESFKAEFGQALLWDAHSIRHQVPSIQKEVFPDLILGNNDETTAASHFIQSVVQVLSQQKKFQFSHNSPFKGGHITRYFGKPEQKIHALQLEMNKILYMDDAEMKYDSHRANEVKALLKEIFIELKKVITK